MGNQHDNCLFYYKPDMNTKIFLEKENKNYIWYVYNNKNILISKNKVDVDIDNVNISEIYFENSILCYNLKNFLEKDKELKDKYIIDYIKNRINKCEYTYNSIKNKKFINYYIKQDKKIFFEQSIPMPLINYIKYTVKFNNNHKIIYVKK